MKKAKAIELLGGSISSAAGSVGVTYQAVDKWPDELPQRIVDRVQAALARRLLTPQALGLVQSDPHPETLDPSIASTNAGV